MTICILCLAGCWNAQELNEIAFVMAIGIDRSPLKEEYQISFQIVNAKKIAGQSNSSESVPVIVYSSTGKTLLEALRKTSQKVPRRINVQHMQTLIIGEKVAKEGLAKIFDLIERDPEPRVTTNVLIARDSYAKTILQTLTPIENIPANNILGKLKTTEKIFGATYPVNIDDVIRGMLTTGGGPVISGIRLTGNPRIGSNISNLEQTNTPAELNIDGMAIFKKDKLVGWLGNDVAKGISRVNNKMKNSIINMNCKNKKGGITLEVLRTKTKVKARIKGKQPTIYIYIHEVGAVSEIICPNNLSKSVEIRKLETKMNEKVKYEVMESIKRAQAFETDIFGFGTAIEREDPEVWQQIKKKWAIIFPICKVKIKVVSKIRRSGEITNSYQYDLDKK